MTLDPVHVDGIARLARHIRHDVDETEHRDLAETVWAEFLDPLYRDGEAVLEPVEDRQRYRAPVEDLGLQDPAFDTVHGLDSGTVNERVFRNGLTVDVAQAAMSATPSSLDLHRSRTIVAGVHTNDATVALGGDWESADRGYARMRVLEVPDLGARERAVHWLALYHAESEHARRHADEVADLLVLDGPLYPKELVNWAESRRRRGLAALVADEPQVATVVRNYVDLVETFLEREVPLVGFVKGARADGLVRALADDLNAPWANDMALFSQVLGREAERTDELAWTSWFVSRLGADGAFARDADPGVERTRDPADYEVAFFVVYDPRTDLAYRAELPLGFARDPDVRDAVRRQVLRGVAAQRGPPAAVAKADSLARIDAGEKESLVETLASALDSREDRSYDDERWGRP